MNYKSSIQKVMAPALEQAGFSFLAIGYNHFRFANGSETQEIVIDTARYGVRNLRFAYHGTGERRFWFGLEDLDPQFCPAAGMEYRTREELIPYLRQVTEDTVRILLPYLDAMVENHVAYTDVLSREMARDIQERIKRAQAQWGLALEYGPDQLRRLDAAMDALRTAAVRRREDFQRHREEILDLAAFYGELLNDEEETPGLWGWREVEPGHPEYVVGPRRYNPLRRAMLAWNFGPEVAAYSLQGYHLKVECRDA